VVVAVVGTGGHLVSGAAVAAVAAAAVAAVVAHRLWLGLRTRRSYEARQG
jgi:hypothetical protein